MQDFFPRGPVGDPDHEATKSPADFLQAFDTSDAIVWRANEPLIMFHHEIDYLIRRDIGRRIPQRCPKILGHLTTTAKADIFNGLFAAFGEMHGLHQTPVLAAQDFAVLLGGFFPNGPQLFETGLPDRIPRNAQGEYASAVFPSHYDTGRRLYRRDSDGERLLIRTQLQDRFVELEPIALHRERSSALKQPDNHP